MKLEEFLEELDVFVNGFQNENPKIVYTVSKAKGVITVLGAYHFPNDNSCYQAFKELNQEFQSVEQQFKVLENKFKHLKIKTNLMDELVAKHYDTVYNNDWNEKTKKAWRTDDYTIVSSISFKYPEKK